MEEAKSEEIVKIEEVTKTGELPNSKSRAACCQSGVNVGGRQIGMKSVVIVGGAVLLALFFLTGNGYLIWGALPFLLILACPLMHLFMHGGKGHKH